MIDLNGKNYKTHDFVAKSYHSKDLICKRCGIRLYSGFTILGTKDVYFEKYLSILLELKKFIKNDFQYTYTDVSISCDESIIKNIIE